MRLPTCVMLLASIAMLTFSCSADPINEDFSAPYETEIEIPAVKTIELEILDLINEHRSSLGLNSLRSMDIVKAQAFLHTDYMIEQDNISHDYFHARKDFLEENAGASKVSENVAYGFSSALSVVTAWLESDYHRNTIEGDYTDFDISAEQNQEGRWFFTNIFIKK